MKVVKFYCWILWDFVGNAIDFHIFSSPEPEAEVSFSDRNLSVVFCCCWSCSHRYYRKLFHVFIFSRTTGPISTKISTKHPWVKGSQVCSDEGPCPFSGVDIENNQKIVGILKKSSSRYPFLQKSLNLCWSILR